MTPEQKQRATNLLALRHAERGTDLARYQHGVIALLQELVDAPGPEPFAVIHLDGSFVHVEFKQPIAGTGKFEVYAAPSVPDGWRDVLEHCIGPLNIALYTIQTHSNCESATEAEAECRYALSGIQRMLAAAPTPAEAPADVARDAERLRNFEQWADQGYAPCLMFDDDGHWQVSFDGMVAVGDTKPSSLSSFTHPDRWHDSVGAAIDAATAAIAAEKGGE